MDVQKLAKVLAMAASDNDAEALHAVRTAKRLLDNAGLDFVALASRLSDSGPVVPPTRLEDLEDTVFDLRNEIRHLRSENERLRQGQPVAAAVAQPNLADTAAMLRLQVELDATQRELQRTLAGAEAAEMALRSDLTQAITALDKLNGQFGEIKARNDRLEAENRRLTLVATALKTELDERLADASHPLPTPTQRPETIARPEPMARVESGPRRAAPHSAARRVGKPVPANQYALF
ncbi:metalloendopeptidase [Paramagnetospirillum marisnigri]|uniref:Metalloendopeptidase n=1 Tax=Paramagnetospirillum marisnigri TaxID=1285242 RepID=A0A178MNC9_9PROT|nr:metalloendopeptidase [Paramagnetospirillum marisnigri]OAN50280.1 metalloendopeptidase [Paramagnetospirillum marisnigri]